MGAWDEVQVTRKAAVRPQEYASGFAIDGAAHDLEIRNEVVNAIESLILVVALVCVGEFIKDEPGEIVVDAGNRLLDRISIAELGDVGIDAVVRDLEGRLLEAVEHDVVLSVSGMS